MDTGTWGAILSRILAIVTIVVVLYWAVYLPNPGGLPRSERFSRLVVRVLAVLAMAVLALYLAVTSLN